MMHEQKRVKSSSSESITDSNNTAFEIDSIGTLMDTFKMTRIPFSKRTTWQFSCYVVIVFALLNTGKVYFILRFYIMMKIFTNSYDFRSSIFSIFLLSVTII